MLRDNIYIHPPSFLFLCLWECDISIEGRRPGHRTEYSAHVFNVKTSPAGSCSIFPQSTWALCPKRWDFLCIQVTGCCFCLMEYSNQLDIKKTWGFYFLEESSVWKMCPLTLASRKLASQSCPARRSQFVIEQVGQPTNRPTEASWQAGLCQILDALASSADGQKYLQSNSVKQ